MKRGSAILSRKRDLLAADAVTAATVRDGAGVVARASASDTAPLAVTQAIDASAHGAVGGTGGVTIETA